MRDSSTRVSFLPEIVGRSYFCTVWPAYLCWHQASQNPLPIFAFLSRTKAKGKKEKNVIVKWNTIGPCSIGISNGVSHVLLSILLFHFKKAQKCDSAVYKWEAQNRIPWQVRMPPGGCAPIQLRCFWLSRHMQLLLGIMKILLISVCVWKKLSIK